MNPISYFALTLVVVLWTVAQVSLKYSFHASADREMSVPMQNLLTSRYFWIWFICSTFATILWLFILRTIPLNQAYPGLGLTYALVPLASQYFLNEKFVLVQWLGIIVIVVGLILVFRT
jgi:undecaprenyl phosphate-alpha-L-ara4N flippase subunit ArnE